jgi:hypothetical protein
MLSADAGLTVHEEIPCTLEEIIEEIFQEIRNYLLPKSYIVKMIVMMIITE